MTERDFALEIVHCLREAGFEALWAGGCVRDELLGLTPADYDLSIDPATADAIRAMAGQIAVVSAERIAAELRKLLVYPQRARGVRLLDELGLVQPLLPELLPMKKLPQGPPSAPTGDLWEHVL